MNETETRAEHIDPALKAAGWGVVEGSRILRIWSNCIAALPDDFSQPLLDGIPDLYMSPYGKAFVLAFLSESRKMTTTIL